MLRINGRMVRNEIDLLLGHACSIFDREIRNYIDLLIYEGVSKSSCTNAISF